MAQKAETVFRKRVTRDLSSLPNTMFFPIQQQTIRGDPDFILCVNGLFIALELKKDEESKPDSLQEYKLSRVSDSKGVALVAHPGNWENTFKFLTETAIALSEIGNSNAH